MAKRKPKGDPAAAPNPAGPARPEAKAGSSARTAPATSPTPAPPAAPPKPSRATRAPEAIAPLEPIAAGPLPKPGPALVPVALALFAIVLAAVADAPADHRFPALVQAARLLGALAAACLAAPSWPLLARWQAPLRLAGIALGTLALGAALGRYPYAFRVFSDAHAGFLGLPTELAGLLAILGARHRARPVGRLLLATGLSWTLAALAFPDASFGSEPWALAGLFSARAPSALAFLALAATAAFVAVQTIRRRPIHARLEAVMAYAPLGFAAVLTVMGCLLGHAPLVSLLSAALVALLALAADALFTAPPEAAPTGRTTRTLEAAILVGILFIWVLVKAQALIASNTDENIYFYMAKQLGDGKLPYVDYFFAHPPLHVLIPGVLFATFGYSLTLAKLVPLISCGLTGVSLWALARRHLGPLAAPLALIFFLFGAEVLKASSNDTGVNLTSLFIIVGLTQHLAGRPLRAGLALGAAATSGFYAIAAVCALLALGFFRAPRPSAPRARISQVRLTVSRVWVLCALVAALFTVLSGVFAPFLAPAIGLGALAAWLARTRVDSHRIAPYLRFGLWQIAGFTLVFAALNVAFYALAGDRFLEGVYSYHTAKFFKDPNMVELFKGPIGFPGSLFHNLGALIAGADFRKELFYHPHLWLAAVALPIVAVAAYVTRLGAAPRSVLARVLGFLAPNRFARDGADGAAAVVWLVALALFVQYAMFRELYSFYFALIYPVLAVALAYVLTRSAELLATAVAERRRWLALACLAIVAIPAAQDRLAASEEDVFDDELEQYGGRNAYEWTVGPIGAPLSDVVRNLFWEDFRLRGDVEPGYRHYLWTKKRAFETLDAVSAYIKAHSAANESIAGASTLAPLIALAADRRIAANEIDTNNKRFKIGMREADDPTRAGKTGPAYILDEAAYWTSICRDNVRFIVSAPRSYFTSQRMESLPTARRWFRRVETFEDHGLVYRGTFPLVLYERVAGPDPEAGAVCKWEAP